MKELGSRSQRLLEVPVNGLTSPLCMFGSLETFVQTVVSGGYNTQGEWGQKPTNIPWTISVL